MHVHMHSADVVVKGGRVVVGRVLSGTPASSLRVVWRKSTASGQMGNCVEIAHLPDGRVAVRNSRNPNGPTLVHSEAGYQALLGRARKW